MTHFWLNILITIILASSVAFFTTIMLLKYYRREGERPFIPHVQPPGHVDSVSTPKSVETDAYVVRSKEIEIEFG